MTPPSGQPDASLQAERVVFESLEPYESARIRAAAIYCSDGRFGVHCDDFLHNSLQLPRYDRLVVPGGPANLAGHFIAYREADALAQQLTFLIEAHGLKRVVLIGHEGCAFYTQRLCVSPRDLLEKQHEDLGRAVERLRNLPGALSVEAYFARLVDQRIQFHQAAKPQAARPSPTWT
ncbi:MAG: hypothetical protein L0Y44_04250 [Phycisphaerales bacterium]|nr:hypothetical protein [Phycisphaerales bacterium]MCI0629850.1 hypothetical protein [Phycisphaerales bacterium]MCI0674861.1 hypothetical protein [Phycisphaerales bacterium]